MKDLLDGLLPQLKRFPGNLVVVATHPRIFQSRIVLADRNPVSGAIYLVAACLSAAILSNLLLNENATIWFNKTLATFILYFCTTLLCGFSMFLSWRAVGYAPKVKETVTLYFYHAGTWNVLMSAVTLAVAGMLMELKGYTVGASLFFLHSLIEGFKEGFKLGYNDPEFVMLLFLPVFAIQIAIMVFWGIGAWGAYHDVYKATWIRSAVGLIIYCGLSTLIFLAFSFTGASLYRSLFVEPKSLDMGL